MQTQLTLFDEPKAKLPVEQAIRTTCASCKAPIIWARTVNGKPIPLNPEVKHVSPNGSGHRLMLITDDGKTVQGFACKSNAAGAQAGRATHFATCPNAAAHRK